MELVNLGKVVKLHGFLGLMKINTKYDKEFDIKKITKLYDEKGTAFSVNRIFSNTDAVVVGLDGVDLEKAKTYVGKQFFVDREILGGKTGYTQEAALCLASYATDGNQEYILETTHANGSTYTPQYHVLDAIKTYDYFINEE